MFILFIVLAVVAYLVVGWLVVKWALTIDSSATVTQAIVANLIWPLVLVCFGLFVVCDYIGESQVFKKLYGLDK